MSLFVVCCLLFCALKFDIEVKNATTIMCTSKINHFFPSFERKLSSLSIGHPSSTFIFPVGKIAKKNTLKECSFVNSALKIQCHIIKNTLPQTALSEILPTGLNLLKVLWLLFYNRINLGKLVTKSRINQRY